MGYQFAGFFAVAGENVLNQALEKWPFCSGKLIHTPFEGIGLSIPLVPQDIKLVESELPLWTANFPDVNFVYLRVECWAGDCDYWGFICVNGNIDHIEEENHSEPTSENALHLLKLLKYVGVNSSYFEPLERGYFGNAQT